MRTKLPEHALAEAIDSLGGPLITLSSVHTRDGNDPPPQFQPRFMDGGHVLKADGWAGRIAANPDLTKKLKDAQHPSQPSPGAAGTAKLSPRTTWAPAVRVSPSHTHSSSGRVRGIARPCPAASVLNFVIRTGVT